MITVMKRIITKNNGEFNLKQVAKDLDMVYSSMVSMFNGNRLPNVELYYKFINKYNMSKNLKKMLLDRFVYIHTEDDNKRVKLIKRILIENKRKPKLSELSRIIGVEHYQILAVFKYCKPITDELIELIENKFDIKKSQVNELKKFKKYDWEM